MPAALPGMASSFRHGALALLLPSCLLVPGTAPGTAEAREGGWHAGAGSSTALLGPDADATSFETGEDVVAAAPPSDDADGDGVADAEDVCPASATGFPVRDNGCALLDGVLGGVDFVAGTASLAPGAAERLDDLATLLVRYPEARIELHVHTDDAGSVREQSILTRARLRTMGLYLVQRRGIRSNRIVLRSFGGTRPLYDNATPENRQRNNRVEVLENTD